MKIQCPSCNFKSQADSSKIPDKGVHIRCPKCRERFFLTKEGEAKKSPQETAPVQKKPPQKKKKSAPVQKKPPPLKKKADVSQNSQKEAITENREKISQVQTEDAEAGKKNLRQEEKKAEAREEDSPGEEILECSKCKHKQPPSPTGMCRYCGTVLPESRQAPKKQEPAPPEKKPDIKQIIPDWEPVRREESLPKIEEQFSFTILNQINRKELKTLFTGFFDLAFLHLITPAIVKVLYAAVIVLGGIATGAAFLLFLSDGNIIFGLAALLSYVFSVISARIWAEFVFLLFKIEENTRHGRMR